MVQEVHWDEFSACARACYLFDLGDGDGDAGVVAVCLLHGVEDDTAYIQVEAHANCIAGHQHIVSAVRIIEQACLRAPHLRRQRTIHHAHPADHMTLFGVRNIERYPRCQAAADALDMSRCTQQGQQG